VWSLGSIAARLADGADPFQYLIWRSVGILVVIEVAARRRRRPVQAARALTSGPALLAGTVALLVASLGWVYAIKTTTAATAAFLASTTPVWAALLGRAVLGERLGRRALACIGLAVVGLLVTVAGDLDVGDPVGNVAALVSALGFAAYTVCVRTDTDEDWSAALPGYGSLLVVLCSVVVLAEGEPLVPAPADVALAVVHGAVFIVVGTLLYNAATRSLPAAAMTVYAQTETLLVPVWALVAFGEIPPAASVVGGALILVAVVGLSAPRRTRDRRGAARRRPFRPRSPGGAGSPAGR
jgi:drug/metabolite transporter (DMT)-like permease